MFDLPEPPEQEVAQQGASVSLRRYGQAPPSRCKRTRDTVMPNGRPLVVTEWNERVSFKPEKNSSRHKTSQLAVFLCERTLCWQGVEHSVVEMRVVPMCGVIAVQLHVKHCTYFQRIIHSTIRKHIPFPTVVHYLLHQGHIFFFTSRMMHDFEDGNNPNASL